MHLGSLECTHEARAALGYHLEQLLRFFRALQTSRVHPQLDIRTLSVNQFLKMISSPYCAVSEPNVYKNGSLDGMRIDVIR